MSFSARKPMQFVKFQYHPMEENMKTVTYSIPNISCNHCVHTIKTEVSDLEGVKTVEANAETKQAVVVFDAPATEEKIVELLKEINYPPADAK
jgi:copper ion binding protein